MQEVGLTELSREGDLEENVLLRRDDDELTGTRKRVQLLTYLHDVRSVRPLEFEGLATEKDVVETPSLGSQDSGNSHLSSLHEESQVDSPGASISSGPRLPGTSVRCVSVSSEGLSVDEDLGDDVDSLFASESEELGNDRGGGELDKDDVVESDSVERVLESHATLDLVSHDHRGEDVLDGEGGFAGSDVGSRDPVGDGHDRSTWRGEAEVRGY